MPGEPSSPAARAAAGLAKISLALKANAARHGFRDGLSPTQAQILVHLDLDAPASLSAVAEKLAITPATASDAVASLIEKGLAKKTRDRKDRRAVRIEPTRKGRGAAARAAAWPDFLTAAAAALTPEEQDALLRALVVMIRALQEQGRIPVAAMCVNCRFFRAGVHRDPERPHHCDFVDAPFGGGDLRLECPDFEAAPAVQAGAAFAIFRASGQTTREVKIR